MKPIKLNPSAYRLSALLYLSKESPSGLAWKVERGRTAKAGFAAGTRRLDGYWRVKIDGIDYFAHRIVFALANPDYELADKEIDHIDGDRSNNNPANLRIATRQKNNMNRALRCDSTSGVVGISWKPKSGKWQAQIKVSGKTIYLGVFDDFDSAVSARQKAEIEYFGKWRRSPINAALSAKEKSNG